jgi:hypothetical protein
MKKFLLILSVLVAGSGFCANTSFFRGGDEPLAAITFESDVIDFGTVTQGSEQIRTFKFTNTGTAPLVISSIKGQCGCTTFPDSWPKDPIPPGGTGSFKVKYDTAVRLGLFDKKIMVYCNASNCVNGLVEVKIKGNVVAQ